MAERLERWVAELGEIGATPGGGVTRTAWSPELAAAGSWLIDRLAEIGVPAEVDAAGNVLGRWDAAQHGPAVLVGSHLDTVPDGGRYDGAFGVLAALEMVYRLRERGFTPRRPVWLVAFNDEEGTRFDTSMFGSHAFVGEDLTAELSRADAEGTRLDEAMRAAGADPAALPGAARVGEVGHYLELHIEQGPRLERLGLPVAVVSEIVGMRGYVITLRGVANHAGTTPMDARHDALAGAARVVLALREAVRARPGMTVNVGRIAVEPGGANVIPGVAMFSIDIRSPEIDGSERADVLVRRVIEEACAAEGLTADIDATFLHQATPLDADLRALLARHVERAGVAVTEMPSGAGHDAMVLARYVPSAMVFVPSRGGVSHAPDEFTPPTHYEPGVTILTDAVAELAG
jgi:hydantoinase/carbamoylase family amidase